MRHGRLATALAFLTVTSLAAAQSPTTDFAVEREPEVPAVAPAAKPASIAAAALALPIANTEDPKKDTPAPLPKTATQIPAGKDVPTVPAPGSAAAPSTGSTAPPGISALPPGGVVLSPNETVLIGNGIPVDSSRYWVSAEFLAMRIKKDTVPPLVTTGPATFPVAFLGNPGTRTLFAGDLDQGTLTGLQLRGGMWMDACHTWGLEVSGFCLPEQNTTRGFNSNQFPVLARPFRDVNPGGPNSEFLAFPGLSTGSITIENTTQLCGGTVAARCPFWSGCCWHVDAIAGLGCLDLQEEVTIVETPRGTANNPFPGGANTQFIATDAFKTRNKFCGVFTGLEASYNYGCWTIGALANVGIGCNHQSIEINGNQIAIPPGGQPTVVAGGLLAVPGRNIGRFTKNECSMVSQLGLNLGYQCTENIQIFGGYTCLYWTNVVRPGEQIDPVLDINRIPNFSRGPAATANRPVAPFNEQNFWIQGVTFGVRFSW
jgi:Putative beta barrel porin-7 (BBP7)